MVATYTPQIGHGGRLQIDTAHPAAPALVDVGMVVDFGTSIDVAEVDVSHQQSPEASNDTPTTPHGPFWAEFIPGKITVEVTFTMVADVGQDEHENVILDHVGVIREWQYKFRDESLWTFIGFYKGIGFSVPNEAEGTGDVTIRVTGKPTFVGDPP